MGLQMTVRSSANIASRLSESAVASPWQRAVVFPAGRDRAGRVTYSHLTFRQLVEETDRLARGLRRRGVGPGMRMVLMVRPSLEFISLTFALFKTGAVVVLIDPGMGPRAMFRCLQEIDPAGFVGIPAVQVARWISRKKFPNARLNFVVGKPKFGLPDYRDLLGEEWTPYEIPETKPTDPAAIIFTSGSTGPAKGVAYEHGMFSAQVDLLREHYNIQPGEIDLPGFPLFALFNSAMGVTTVIPEMDPTRPAKVNPEKIAEAIANQGVTQAFGSPAIWNRVGRYAESRGREFPSVRRVLSAGAPVPLHVIERMSRVLTGEGGEIFTPYGATEALPVCSIGSKEILGETADLSRQGKGTCVGKPFPQVEVRIIPACDEPISELSATTFLPAGEIGEIIVRSPSATREYFRRPEATRLAKIPDGEGFWHRMGDVGYLDASGRLWFCGRKAHTVFAETGPMYTIPCEAIFNNHPRIFRSALVGIGPKGKQRPVIIAEPESGQFPGSKQDEERLRSELLGLGRGAEHTRGIETILFHESLPVDIRHNVKIFREKLGPWAEKQLR